MQRLLTEEGSRVPGIPWAEYPRPQMRRAEWKCLNGEWSFRIGSGLPNTIRVPFCPESLLSGVSAPPAAGDELNYERSFRIPEAWAGKRVLLHFGAVSRDCRVAVNGIPLFRHENGYLPFTVDITEAIRPGENEISLKVIHDLSPVFPYGKQSARRGGMWYTPCSGIWQTVWIEPVPENYIRQLIIHTGSDWMEAEAVGITEGCVEFQGNRIPLRNGKAHIDVADPVLWSPESPYLYEFSVRSAEDSVTSYFALRTLTVETVSGIPRLCLNGKPYYFNGLLDQGYWSDGLYTPASPECFEKDIIAMKSLGFNTLRKHAKIEAEQFYYDCDRLGMIVFQDMVNSGKYLFVRDTLLPNLRFQRRNDKRMHSDRRQRAAFLDAMEKTVSTLGNHPCIALWSIFNEGWGQFCADDCCRRLRKLDPTRFIDSTSGWFRQHESDVDSLHIYFTKLRLGKRRGRPCLLSEFGGFVWKDTRHSFNTEKTYGYKVFKSREEFVSSLRSVYTDQIAPLIARGLCGSIYTQVSDVEDETNGLLTFDRKVLKIQPEEIADAAGKLARAISAGKPM